MAFDIFISYSRKDSAEALDLVERLRADGMTVWIDRHGIGGAKQWAGEIASAIRDCRSLLLLISENAMESSSVLKEVSLASEKSKRILPVVLRRTPIPATLEYHLAGIHYLHYADYDSIAEALKNPVSGTLTAIQRDDRKSLLVLPFEDLSPEQDNAWFSDGLTSELITSLSKIKSLRVIDRNTTMDFKGARGRTRDIARDLDVRYFLEGNVRKFGDQIKISVELLDVETGDYLWHDSQKGIFADIFGIQEDVAKKVVEGLELTLSGEEAKTIGAIGTNNPDAYEFYLRATDYYYLWTRQGMLQAIDLSNKTIELDPHFPKGLVRKALALSNLYRLWDRDIRFLHDAELLLLEAQRLTPNQSILPDLVGFYLLKKDVSTAEEIALKNIRDAPNEFISHSILGYFYFNTGQIEKAIQPYEQSIRLNPKDRLSYWNLTEALDRLGRNDDRKRYSVQALPHFERWLQLHPEDQFARAQLATFQLYTGEKDKALRTIDPLVVSSDADGLALYTVAGIFMHLGESETAIATLERAIGAGFSHVELLKSDPNFAPVAETPKFQNLLERMNRETT